MSWNVTNHRVRGGGGPSVEFPTRSLSTRLSQVDGLSQEVGERRRRTGGEGQ